MRGSSCCADSKSPVNYPHLRPLSSSRDVSLSTQAWFNVFSHKKSNCSRCTQCAAVVHLPDAIPSSVRQSRIRRAKKKQEKQQRKHLEIVLPSDFHPTVSILDINEEILYSMEVTQIVLPLLLQRESNGDVFTSLISLCRMIYETT